MSANNRTLVGAISMRGALTQMEVTTVAIVHTDSLDSEMRLAFVCALLYLQYFHFIYFFLLYLLFLFLLNKYLLFYIN